MTTLIWSIMILGGMLLGLCNGRMALISEAILEAAGEAAALCGSLLGVYCLFMGLMRIAEQTGFATWTAKLCRRPLARLFPSLRGNREALGSIAMNISANLLGMGNAATPFGLKAMADLQKINENPQIASDEMCMFILLNTASVQLLPLTVISMRAAAGAAQPWDITLGSFLTTLVSAVLAVVGGMLARGRRR